MADLEKPITTQEDFDTAIKDRLTRQETKIRGEYSDYEDLKMQSEKWGEDKNAYEQKIAQNKKDYDTLNSLYQEATKKIAGYEADALRTKVAIESGIPLELRGYLKGSSEEEIKASAAELGKFAKGSQAPPLADPEGEPPKDNTEKAMRNMLKELKGEK